MPNNRFALARYKENGSLDTSFSGDGKVTTNLTSSSDEVVNALAIDAKGRIVVAGYATVEGEKRFALGRYRANGSLDTSFSGDGKVVTNFSSSTNEGANAMAIDAQGRIVVGGYANVIGTGSTPRFALARYNEDGSLDTSFSGDGKVITDVTTTMEQVNAIAIDSQGRIVVGGRAGKTSGTGTKLMFALARYQPNGDLDTTFAGNGMLTTSFLAAGPDAGINAMAIDAQDRIVAAGYAGSLFGSDVALARYKDNGDLDPTFSGDGKRTTHFDDKDSVVRALVIDGQGRIVVAGYALPSGSFGAARFGLARFEANGDLDATFAGNGKLVTDFTSSFTETVHAIAIDAKGRIVVAGIASPTGSHDRIAVARYRQNGDLDTSFSQDGMLMTDFTSSPDEFANAVAIDPDGRIVVAGQAAG